MNQLIQTHLAEVDRQLTILKGELAKLPDGQQVDAGFNILLIDAAIRDATDIAVLIRTGRCPGSAAGSKVAPGWRERLRKQRAKWEKSREQFQTEM